MASPNKRDSSGTFRRILIAVDFGTTYSAMAWAQTARSDVHALMNQWPDGLSSDLEGMTSDKVPTDLVPDGRWGFMISEYEDRYQWFKLELDSSRLNHRTGLAKKYPNNQALSPAYDKDGEALCTEYLTKLREQGIKVLDNQIGKAARECTPIAWIITVPAVWDEAGQDKTRRCAEKAGMGEFARVHIISEPEAAVIYALDTMDPNALQIDDTYILCDAGGGTGDCISYTITMVRPSLHVKEAAPGIGGLCGSTYLNRIFKKYLRDQFGKLTGWSDEAVAEAMQRFETAVKRSFRGGVTEAFWVPVPGIRDNTARGVKRGRHSITGATLEPMFEEVIDEMVALVKDQIKATPGPVKGILLVGGFGQSPLLRESIRKAIGDIPVIQPPNGWTAVVRGALIKGLAEIVPSLTRIKIDARVARKHYGTQEIVKYDPKVHESRRKFWCAFSGEYYVEVMAWFINRGKEVKDDETESFDWMCHSRVSKGLIREKSQQIYVCKDPENKGAPLYPDDARITPLATLVATFGSLATIDVPTQKGKDGNMYYAFDYQIRLAFASASVEYSCWRDDKRYGAVSAEYD